MPKKRYSVKLSLNEFVAAFTQFTSELGKKQENVPEAYRIKTENGIMGLFELWFWDSREQELLAEGREKEAEDEQRELYGFQPEDEEDEEEG